MSELRVPIQPFFCYNKLTNYIRSDILILYVAILKTIDKEKDEEILDIHKAYLQKYIDSGKIYAKGPFTDHTGGLVIYNVNSYEEAKELAENDPAVLQNTRELTLKEWRSNL